MSPSVLRVTPRGAAACSMCPRPASFQARVESPDSQSLDGQPLGGQGHALRRANACAGHLVEVIEGLRAWARARQLTDGWVTALAIDPYALPRLAARGITEHGFAFYTAPLIPVSRSS
jgi:hypothetical protein